MKYARMNLNVNGQELDWDANGRFTLNGKEPGVPEPILRKLLSLCHPDKHGNSQVSTEVTRWLLEQRKK